MKKTLVLLLGLLLFMTACSSKTEHQIQPIAVEVETVSASTEDLNRSYVGTIEEEEAVSVSFTGMGTLKRVLVSEGQAVHQGQLLAELDDTQAQNLLDAAKASYHQAEDAIARYKQLYDKGSLAESKWIEAQSRLDEMKASLRSAEKNLKDCRLVAPVSGIVGKKQMTAGMTALPSEPVMTLYKINNVKVKVSVPEREIAEITAHTPSQISVKAANVKLAGGRIEKGVVADPLTHTYDIRIMLDNKEQMFLPGMVCDVLIGLNRSNSQEHFSLPVRCIQQSADGTLFVWIVDASCHVKRQLITLGETQGNRIEILSGLTQGMKVIIAGYQKVSEGEEVVI